VELKHKLERLQSSYSQTEGNYENLKNRMMHNRASTNEQLAAYLLFQATLSGLQKEITQVEMELNITPPYLDSGPPQSSTTSPSSPQPSPSPQIQPLPQQTPPPTPISESPILSQSPSSTYYPNKSNGATRYHVVAAEQKATYEFLGISIQDLTPSLADTFNVKDINGVLVSDVIKDLPADKAGIKPGDVIIEFSGKPVQKADELQERVGKESPGTKVEIAILCEGKKKILTVILAEISSTEKLGITVQNLTEELASRYSFEGFKGVIVTQVVAGSPAAMAGIQLGSLIQEVNHKSIENTKEFTEEIDRAVKEGRVLFRIRYENSSIFIILPLILERLNTSEVTKLNEDETRLKQELDEINRTIHEKSAIIDSLLAGTSAGITQNSARIESLEVEKRRLIEKKVVLQTRLDMLAIGVGKTATVNPPVIAERSNAVAAHSSGASESINFKGRVTEIDSKNSLAKISIGSADGVKEGLKFHVIRDNQFVCDLLIIDVDSVESAGAMELVQMQPMVGDSVSTSL
jgi:hypothetical protein